MRSLKVHSTTSDPFDPVQMNSEVHSLGNGLRLVYTWNPGPVSHCALLIDAGTRDEPEGKSGIAHFLEHVFFKGTKRRKAYQILNRLEVVGGELNAFTTREDTCIHASFSSEYLGRTFDLISDIIQNSRFPQQEIEREKDVVIDEINSYLDNPMELIMDDFESQVFRGNSLGNPILGTHETVRGYRRKDLLEFVKSNYQPDRMVMSYSGPLPFNKVVYQFEKYFDGIRSVHDKVTFRKRFRKKKPEQHLVSKNIAQSHHISGTTTFSIHHPKRHILILLNNILGGPGLNSRLNMNIREKHGYTYHVESSYVPFSDTGLFSVYLSAEKRFMVKALKLIEIEMDRLRNRKISPLMLRQFKKQYEGQVMIGLENRSNYTVSQARSMIAFNKPIMIRESLDRIGSVTAVQLMEVANEVFDSERMSSLEFIPSEPHTGG
jgi:predicted Zn-dependent peptidase